jgi:hypothetical protein
MLGVSRGFPDKPPECVNTLDTWKQGDYTLSILEFLVADGISGAELDTAFEPVHGLVVVTQTCDIVNMAPGKDYVTVCPLIALTETSLRDVQKGRSPTAAVIENPPLPNIVADLGRMMSLHKTVLAKLERREGFTTDYGRTKFAEALQRKHGRFAFPDKFNDEVLSKLRDRVLSSHGKPQSDHGKAYRSIETARATAFPNWDGADIEVAFHFILLPEGRREASRAQIAKTLDEHFKKITWPIGIRSAYPQYYLVVLEEMTAAEWTQSQPIDWDFVSSVGAGIANHSADLTRSTP